MHDCIGFSDKQTYVFGHVLACIYARHVRFNHYHQLNQKLLRCQNSSHKLSTEYTTAWTVLTTSMHMLGILQMPAVLQ